MKKERGEAMFLRLEIRFLFGSLGIGRGIR